MSATHDLRAIKAKAKAQQRADRDRKFRAKIKKHRQQFEEKVAMLVEVPEPVLTLARDGKGKYLVFDQHSKSQCKAFVECREILEKQLKASFGKACKLEWFSYEAGVYLTW